MNTSNLLQQCRELGICVAVNDDRLHVEAPAGVLTPAISAGLKTNKQTIIQYLSVNQLHQLDQVTPQGKVEQVGEVDQVSYKNIDEVSYSTSPTCPRSPRQPVDQVSYEAYEERAAIIEYEGGLDRGAAEVLAKGLCSGSTMDAWAVIEPDGRILVDSVFKTAADAWRVGLGWPDDGEVENAKRRGYQVERVTIVRDVKRP